MYAYFCHYHMLTHGPTIITIKRSRHILINKSYLFVGLFNLRNYK